MGDLHDLDRRKREPRGDVGLRVGAEEDIGRAVRRDEHDGVEVGVLARTHRRLPARGRCRRRRPTRKLEPARTTRIETPRSRAAASASSLSGPVTWRPGLENLRDVEPANHLGRTPDVIALRMRENDGAERVDSHADQLAGHVGFRRALVDEDPSPTRLEQHGISLPDVQERHAEAGRWVPRRRGGACATHAVGDESSAGREQARDHSLLRRETPPSLSNDEPRHSRADRERERGVGVHSSGWQDRRRPERRARATLPPSPRAPRARRQPRARPGRPPRPAARARARAERPGTRGRSPAPCTPAPGRSGRGRSAPSRDRRRGQRRAPPRRRRKRQAVELAPDARNGDEDRGDGGERQLEAGLEERRRHPRHQHERADARRSASGRAAERRARRAMRELRRLRRARPTAASRPQARRRRSRRASRAPGALVESRKSQPSSVDARGEERDVLPRDGEQVVEPGGAEVVLHVVRQPFVLAEHDAEDDAAADAGRASPDGALDPVAKAIPEAGNPAASADLSPARCLRARRGCPGARASARSSKPSSAARGSATRTVASRIAPRGGERPTGRTRSTRSCTCARRNVRVTAMTRVDHGDERAGATVTSSATPALAELGRQNALAERIHAQRSPRRARERRERRRQRRAARRRRAQHAADSATSATAPATAIGTETQIESASPTHAAPTRSAGQWSSTIAPHGVTSSRSCSIRVGPMPGTASRSSTEANGPCSVR